MTIDKIQRIILRVRDVAARQALSELVNLFEISDEGDDVITPWQLVIDEKETQFYARCKEVENLIYRERDAIGRAMSHQNEQRQVEIRRLEEKVALLDAQELKIALGQARADMANMRREIVKARSMIDGLRIDLSAMRERLDMPK